MSSQAAMKHFINAPSFAVVGRVLTDRSRFDHKVLKWYQNHGLPVVPVKPDAASTEEAESLAILSSPRDIPSLKSTSISIIINPKISLEILKSLYPQSPIDNEPWGVWFQPGAYDSKVEAYVQERGIGDRVVMGGECILVSGETLLRGRKVESTSRL